MLTRERRIRLERNPRRQTQGDGREYQAHGAQHCAGGSEVVDQLTQRHVLGPGGAIGQHGCLKGPAQVRRMEHRGRSWAAEDLHLWRTRAVPRTQN